MQNLFRKAENASPENEAAHKAERETLARRLNKIVVRAREDLPGLDYARLSKRIRSKHVGVITAPGGGAINCLVVDMNETGFCLELSQPADLPEAFSLYVPALQLTCSVEKRWASQFKLGVALRS